MSPEQLDEMNKDLYVDNVLVELEQAIKLRFPGIPNLVVTEKSVSFDDGMYTKQEVEAFIKLFSKNYE